MCKIFKIICKAVIKTFGMLCLWKNVLSVWQGYFFVMGRFNGISMMGATYTNCGSFPM